MTAPTRLDRDRLAGLMATEVMRFADAHPRSAALHETARRSLLEGVPMPWMTRWAGPFPPYVEVAAGAHFTCVDGHNMALVSPATVAADVDRHTEVFAQAVAALFG